MPSDLEHAVTLWDQEKLMSDALYQRLDSLIAEHTSDPFSTLPRAVVLVASRYGVLYEGAGGYDQVPASRSKLVEFQPDTTKDSIFEYWSLTKLFTTVACLILVERGQLNEQDDVARWLPQIADVPLLLGYREGKPVVERIDEPVTVKMLLTHTAGSVLGLGNAVTPDFNRYIRNELGLTQLGSVYANGDAELLSKVPFTSKPGEQWQYSYCLDVRRPC